jgi:RHS repeat-associated protein
MPPISSSAGTGLVTSAGAITGAFTVSNGAAIAGQLKYDEALAGFDFGTIVRFVPSAALPNNISITTAAGALVDEWGNPNAGETISFTLSGATGNVLFPGEFLPGSTAPQRIARSDLGSSFLFHGQFFDFDSGLAYMRARFYDPYSGEFLQRDPAQYEYSVNLYAAFGQNPMSLRDPTGADIVEWLKAAWGGVKAAASGETRAANAGGKLAGQIEKVVNAAAKAGRFDENFRSSIKAFNPEPTEVYNFSAERTQILDPLRANPHRDFKAFLGKADKLVENIKFILRPDFAPDIIWEKNPEVEFNGEKSVVNGAYSLGRGAVRHNIRINFELSLEQMAQTLGHELGHAFLQLFGREHIGVYNSKSNPAGVLAEEYLAELHGIALELSHNYVKRSDTLEGFMREGNAYLIKNILGADYLDRLGFDKRWLPTAEEYQEFQRIVGEVLK